MFFHNDFFVSDFIKVDNSNGMQAKIQKFIIKPTANGTPASSTPTPTTPNVSTPATEPSKPSVGTPGSSTQKPTSSTSTQKSTPSTVNKPKSPSFQCFFESLCKCLKNNTGS